MTDATEPPSGPKSLTTQAFQRLRGDILSGVLRPGTRLRIQNLSERYAIGTTAIREALSRLVTDGLVESADMRGFGVTPVSRDELVDLTQTRIEVECLALRCALQRGDLEWEAALISAFHRVAHLPRSPAPQSGAAWAAAHREFHRALISACDSPWKLRLCNLLYDKSERYRNLAAHHSTPESRDTVDEHRRLMDAALARDPAACDLLTDHFWATTNIILKAHFDGAAQVDDTASASTPRRAGSRT